MKKVTKKSRRGPPSSPYYVSALLLRPKIGSRRRLCLVSALRKARKPCGYPMIPLSAGGYAVDIFAQIPLLWRGAPTARGGFSVP
jgi:hypothetical protein